MEWADDQNLTYSIRKLPSKREWGKDMPFENKSSILCQTGSNIPYTIWILGRVSKLWFFDRGNPASQVSINIMPLDTQDGVIARQLLATYSHPDLRRHFYCSVYSVPIPVVLIQRPLVRDGAILGLPNGRPNVPEVTWRALFAFFTAL